MENAISLHIDALVLEGRWAQKSGTHAVIVTHPHPLYGGDMDNSVVQCLAGAYARLGWSVLRFNFRGTGNSTGAFEDGVGEQRDVQSAIDFLTGRGFQHIDLAGYSFGGWVLAQWAARHPDHLFRLFLVAPPVAFIDFSHIGRIPGLHRVICGSLDDLAPPRQIDHFLGTWNPRARQTVLQGADHSFYGKLDLLEQTMIAAIGRRLPGTA